MDYVRSYVSELQETLQFLPVGLINRVINILHDTRMKRGTIFVMGNGGSASTASHFVADLSKNTRREGIPGFRVIGLTDNMALLSAYANDEGYENVFAQQLASFILPQDVVIAISASGNSPNVLKAVELANRVGATTIAMTGFTGGALGNMVDINLHVPSVIIEQVEDVHLMLEHLITKALREIGQGLERSNGHVAQVEQGQPTAEEVVIPAPRPSLEMLYTISRALNEDLKTSDLLRRTLELSLESVGAASGSIMMFDENGHVVEAAMAYGGEVHDQLSQQLTDTVEQGLAGWVVENRQAALVPSTCDDPRWLPREWEQNCSISRSAVSVPLMDRDRVAGVLTLVHSQAGKFNQDHLVLLAAIAVFVSFSTRNGAIRENGGLVHA